MIGFSPVRLSSAWLLDGIFNHISGFRFSFDVGAVLYVVISFSGYDVYYYNNLLVLYIMI